MNRYQDHIYVIPEDDANRQIALGFVQHSAVNDRSIQIMPVAGGWTHTLKTFEDEYVPKLFMFERAHVVLLIDFDHMFAERLNRVRSAIPPELTSRVFVLGSRDNPEALKRATVAPSSFERIGRGLADDCEKSGTRHWDHDHLRHNEEERLRLSQAVRRFLFS